MKSKQDRCGMDFAKSETRVGAALPREPSEHEDVSNVSNGILSPHSPEDGRAGRCGRDAQSRRGQARVRRRRPDGRDRLCRRARRFRLEPGARRRDQVAEGSAGRQGRRGRERARDRRGLQVDGIDDQSRRRRASFWRPRSAITSRSCSTWRRNIRTSSFATPRRCGTRTRTRRTPAPTSAISIRLTT